MRQRTLKHSVRLSGIGLHTGEIIHVLLKPSKTLGISFNNIKVSPDTVFGTSLCTKIGQVRTIEHLMCALSILNITNLDVILDGDEIPILDGGASEFVNILKDDVLELDGTVMDFFIPSEGIEVIDENDPEKYIRAYPSEDGGLSISLKVDFNGLKQQFFYNKDISTSLEFLRARTFCYLRDVEEMQKNGMALGGNLNNSIVLDNDNNPINHFLFDNELAKHKMIDFIGDLSALGFPVIGRIECSKPGHTINNLFVRKLKEKLNV